jgi:hypothetical protein
MVSRDRRVTPSIHANTSFYYFFFPLFTCTSSEMPYNTGGTQSIYFLHAASFVSHRVTSFSGLEYAIQLLVGFFAWLYPLIKAIGDKEKKKKHSVDFL